MNETIYYQKKQKELEALISKLERRQENYIEGKLRVSSSGGYYKYYRRDTDSPDAAPEDANATQKDEAYLGKEDRDIAQQLAQQEYEAKLLTIAKKLLRKASAKAAEYDDHILQDVFAKLPDARKALVTPLILTDDEYAEKWMNRNYEPGFFTDNAPLLYTEHGDRVRSKSEKIIADKYFHRGVPYLYEYPLNLKSGKQTITLYPDFTVLNKRTRRQYIHEHFGMIDRPDYADQMLKKLELYAANGIFPGESLLITMESSAHVFNEALLNQIIETYLV